MDLLPKSSEEFSSQKYWDEFFSKRKEDPFEWYGEYPELAGLLHKYISPKDNLLVVGCGNSTLSYDLYIAGIKNQKSLDISSVVVSQMQKSYPHLEFIQGDVTAMEFSIDTFSCILDKGTFDALSPPPNDAKKSRNKSEILDADNEDGKVKVNLMMEEINRVVRPGGRFICVSLLQPHVASRLLSFFHSLGWMTRVVRCLEAEKRTADKGNNKSVVFPVFMVIFTKIKLPPGMKPVLEAASLSNSSTMTRFESLEELMNSIKDQQNFALIKRGLLQLGFCAEKGLQLNLANGSTGEDRYILNVVDVPKLLNNPVDKRFGVFVVPQGRESEWLFGTHEGRICLATEAGFTRLVVVHLVRGQKYESMNKIQEEIKNPLASLSPLCVTEKNIQAPIMTVENEVGDRDIVYQGQSDFSGDFVVEDVSCDRKIFRRLIFLNNPNVIQSEVEINIVKKRGKEFKVPLTTKLSCQHHGLMTVSFGILKYFFTETEVNAGSISGLLIGLGGGLLASFLINFMPNLSLSVVEIDPEIVKVAKDHFGLPESNERLKVVVDDGLKFIQSTESQYNIILIDVDNKSTKEGLSCPPPDFLDKSSIEYFKSKMDPKGSIFVLNLVCRNEALKKGYMAHVRQLFPFVYACDVPDEVNTILFCFSEAPSSNLNPKNLPQLVKQSIEWVNAGNFQDNCNSNSGISKDKRKKAQHSNNLNKTDDCFCGALSEAELLSGKFKILKL